MISTIQAIVIGITCAIFGGLLSFFIAVISQRSYFLETMKEEIEETIKTHVNIHHKDDPSAIVNGAITRYEKEVEYKLTQRDERLQKLEVKYDQIITKQLHSLSMAVAWIITKLDGDPKEFNL